MADSTVLTETEKSNHLITMCVMMTIMYFFTIINHGIIKKLHNCKKQLPFSILHENTPRPPPSPLLWHFEFSCILFILSGNARHAKKRVLTVRQKQMTFIRISEERYEEEDLCLLCIIVCLWVRVCLYLCVVLGFPLCWFAYFAVFLWLETECIIGDLMMVYVDFDHLNLGSIEMKVVPQQKGLMIIWI